RTVALTVFGDLDTSLIHQLPPGRKPVVTRLQSEKQRDKVYETIRAGLEAGRHAFVVCPLVEAAETLDVNAAEHTSAVLKAGLLAAFGVGLLHGRVEDTTKDSVMAEFRRGAIDLLVATVVIEVGVDVPNATLMVVEGAERFGLSQLHQLRGRVSRGTL